MSNNDIHFNQPEGDSRLFKPIKKGVSPGLTPEEHKRIVDDICKQAGVKAHDIPDIDRLLNEAKQRIKNVRDYATLEADAASAQGHDINRPDLFRQINHKLLDNFNHYSQEELFVILTTLLAQMVMNEVV